MKTSDVPDDGFSNQWKSMAAGVKKTPSEASEMPVSEFEVND